MVQFSFKFHMKGIFFFMLIANNSVLFSGYLYIFLLVVVFVFSFSSILVKGVQCYELFGGIALKIHTFSFSFQHSLS